MATLKGQNFRILIQDGSTTKVVGMATNCTVNLTGNTEEATHKDITGNASRPEITSKAWSVSVESLNTTDVNAMLTAMKAMTPFTLIWDETSTTNNQSATGAAFARKGSAYLTDATFNFDDRSNATKSLQFTGSGALSTISSAPTVTTQTPAGYTKGQFVRLFLSDNNSTAPSKPIAYAKSLSFHVSMTLEDATTKDTAGDWQVQEPTALNFDISSSALVRSGETISATVGGQELSNLQTIYENSSPVKFFIANASGANNRTKGSIIVSGSVVLTSLEISGPIGNATYKSTLTGYGDYTVGS